MQLPKTYEHQQHESAIYQQWEASGVFTPQDRGEGYCVLMPPPNANADLHMGHALTTAIQDLLIRFERMRGKAVLYLPGADHAGFETQVVYEKKLEQQGKSRFDFSREELYEQIWNFVENNKSTMENQLRQLGASADWSRYTYSLDAHIIERTYETFQRLWNDGLIYRGKRIVNYCTHHRTSFSELEVEYQEVKSKLYRLRYPLENKTGEIEVATTRPETMLGDTAVAVHPEDKRYQKLIGESVHLPLVGRPIPIVADKGVDPEFGTGAVKVTPGHDQLDFEIGERHQLPAITVIGHDGRLSDDVPAPYRGLSVTAARQQVLKDLKKQGFLLGEAKYSHSVGHCYKCGTVIEPLLRDQWLLTMEPLAKAAIKALDEGQIEIIPASQRKVLYHWLTNIKDWNLSRQIAWGIPIPAFQNVDDPEEWIFSDQTAQETLKVDGKLYRRDPDVFDTWFSSGQWPFATLRYPDGEDFKRFYPTSLMETGFDILFFWVARMIMLGLYATGEVPFRCVYLHGMVMDEAGQKMSKSKGNVINPQALAERYGADALRMGLISGRSPGQSQGFAENRVEGMRNFANKLWNVARFVVAQAGESYAPQKPAAKTLGERWLMHRLSVAAAAITRDLEHKRLAQAQEKLYDLVWGDFADWYVEIAKHEPNLDLLVYGLETVLKLAHPFAPFVSEAIWQQLPWQKGLLISAEWPKLDQRSARAAGEFARLQALISEIRALKAELNLGPTPLYHQGAEAVARHEKLIAKLAGVSEVTAVSKGRGLPLLSSQVNAWLGVDTTTIKGYVARLENEKKELGGRIEQLEQTLANRSFSKRAPKAVVASRRESLASAQERLKQLNTQLKRLKAL